MLIDIDFIDLFIYLVRIYAMFRQCVASYAVMNKWMNEYFDVHGLDITYDANSMISADRDFVDELSTRISGTCYRRRMLMQVYCSLLDDVRRLLLDVRQPTKQ